MVIYYSDSMFQIISLKRHVEDSLLETIRRIMQELFSDNFLSQYSYKEFKEKQQCYKLYCNIRYDIL